MNHSLNRKIYINRLFQLKMQINYEIPNWNVIVVHTYFKFISYQIQNNLEHQWVKIR